MGCFSVLQEIHFIFQNPTKKIDQQFAANHLAKHDELNFYAVSGTVCVVSTPPPLVDGSGCIQRL